MERAFLDPGRRRVLALAVPTLRRRRGTILRIVAFSWGASLLAMIQPWLSKVLVDEGALAGDMRILVASCAGMLIAPLLGLLLEAANRFVYLDLSSDVLFRLREQVFAHLQSLSPNYFSRVGFGDLVGRFDGDLAEVQRFVVDAPLALIGGVFNLLVLIGLMVWLNPLLACVVLVTAPLPLAATWARRRGIEAATRTVRERATKLSGYFLDSLRAVKHIQATNHETARLEGLRAHHGDYHQALRASQQAGFLVGVWQRLSGTLGMAVVIGTGGWLLMHGQTSVGVLIAFVGFAARAGGPINTLAGVIAGWQRARVSLARVAELLDAAPARDPAQASARLPSRRAGHVEFDRVAYRPAPDVRVLREASFVLAPGSKTVLLGPSGAGKSTVADLLRGLCAPEAGSIRVDGVDIATVDTAELRRRVVVVDQEPVFFPGTVADNLRQARPGASDAEMTAALLDAGLDPAKVALDRPVGAAQYALSRGERMRLALARAILHAPCILVLDETTSAVDRGLARSIVATVDRLFAGRTRLIVTHDRALAGAADAVLLLRDGVVMPQTTEWAHAG